MLRCEWPDIRRIHISVSLIMDKRRRKGRMDTLRLVLIFGGAKSAGWHGLEVRPGD